MPQGVDYLVLIRLGMPMVIAIMIKIVCLFKQVKQMLWNVILGISWRFQNSGILYSWTQVGVIYSLVQHSKLYFFFCIISGQRSPLTLLQPPATDVLVDVNNDLFPGHYQP